MQAESCSIPAIPTHPAEPGRSGPCGIVQAALADAETVTLALRERRSIAYCKDCSVGS